MKFLSPRTLLVASILLGFLPCFLPWAYVEFRSGPNPTYLVDGSGAWPPAGPQRASLNWLWEFGSGGGECVTSRLEFASPLTGLVYRLSFILAGLALLAQLGVWIVGLASLRRAGLRIALPAALLAGALVFSGCALLLLPASMYMSCFPPPAYFVVRAFPFLPTYFLSLLSLGLGMLAAIRPHLKG